MAKVSKGGRIASKKKALRVAVSRAAAGLTRDILDRLSDAYFDQGLSLGDAFQSVQDDIANDAIGRYSEKIRAALGRAGLDLPAGEALTIQSIESGICDKLGLQVGELSAESITAALDDGIAARLSEAVGFPIESVLSGVGIGDQIRAGVTQAIAEGRENKRFLGATVHGAQSVMTWQRRGFETPEKRKKALSAIYQKRYRRTHKEVWL